MARWHKNTETKVLFLTGNTYRCSRLFRRPDFCRLMLESLDYCRTKYAVKVYGFVLMPDHFHLLIGVPAEGVLSNFLRDWKGFTARSIVKRLQEQKRSDRLEKLRAKATGRRKDSHFRIFQPDTHVEGILSARFARQKLNYIHKNPIEAGLAEQLLDYPYSSARSWLLNDHSVFRVDPLEL